MSVNVILQQFGVNWRALTVAFTHIQEGLNLPVGVKISEPICGLDGCCASFATKNYGLTLDFERAEENLIIGYKGYTSKDHLKLVTNFITNPPSPKNSG